MKKSLLFLAWALLFISINVAGQSSIIVTPKKVVYTRKNAEPEKKHFDIRYPIVKGALAPAVKRKLENTISYWRVFQTSLKESMEETYLSSLDYKVNYNQNGILDISLFQEGVGAYPSTGTVNLAVNLKTGAQIKFNDVFKPSSSARLAALVDKKLGAEKRKIIKQVDADKDETQESKDSLKEQIDGLKFTTESFNEFRVGSKGVTILYDAGFPHVIQALQPDGEYFFTYAELKPFLKPDGLLGKFVR